MDECHIQSDSISHDGKIRFGIDDYKEQIPIFDIMLEHYPFIIAIPSLQLHHI